MQMAFELGVNILEIGIILDFINRYFGFKYDPPKCYIYYALIYSIMFMQLTSMNYYSPFGDAATYIAFILIFLYALLCLQGEPLVKFFISVFIVTAIILIANGCILLISNLLKCNPGSIVIVFGPIRLIAVMLSKIILFYFTRILLRVKEQSKLEVGDILPLIIIPSLSLLGISLMMKTAYQDPKVQQIVLYAVLIIFAVNLITYYLFVRLSKESLAKIEHLLLQQQYEIMRQNIHEVGLMYQEIRGIRHDMKNHLLSISILLNQHNNTKAMNYVTNLLQQHETVDYQLFQTGNEVLDAVLGIKLAVCRKEDIAVKVNIQDSLSFMKPTDVSALFANLIDNATEACRKCASRKIGITIVPQHAYVCIVICNSIQSSVLKDNPGLATTKVSGFEHGFGLRNIRKIISQYNGMLDYYEENSQFFFEILLEKSAK